MRYSGNARVNIKEVIEGLEDQNNNPTLPHTAGYKEFLKEYNTQ